MPTLTSHKLLSCAETAERLGCSAKTVRLLDRRGLASVRFSEWGRFRLDPGELAGFVEQAGVNPDPNMTVQPRDWRRYEAR